MILFACLFAYILGISLPLFLSLPRRDFLNSLLSGLNLGVCADDSKAPSSSEWPWLSSPRLTAGIFTYDSAIGYTG